MNKVYKVVWNQHKARYVVTSEAQHSMVKPKSATALLCAASLLMGTPLLSEASNIVTANDWNHTTVVTQGQVHTINTDYIRNEIGVNHFSQFEISQKEIANMVMPGTTDRLLNFVDNHITVDGTVNALKGNKVGGALFFVSPSGMTVGTTGVINAGRLNISVPLKKDYNDWSTLSSKGHLLNVDEALIEKLNTGTFVMDPKGVITVNGSLNAGNQIVLAAADIRVGKTGTLSNKTVDFNDLVNIKNDKGQIVVASGLEADQVVLEEASDGSGDILLSAIAQRHTDDPLEDTQSTKIAIEGNIKARGNVTVQALSGKGQYDPAHADEGRLFVEDGSSLVPKVNAEILVSGEVSAQEAITIKALTETTITGDGGFEVSDGIALEILGTLTPINGDVAFADMKSKASVEVTDTARLIAQKDVDIKAEALSSLTIGSNTSMFAFLLQSMKGLSKKMPAVAVTAGLIDTEASVVFEGQIQTPGNVNISSLDKLEAELSALSATAGTNAPPIAFLYAQLDGNASTVVGSSADIATSETSNVSVSSIQLNKVKTSSEVALESDAEMGLAFNLTQFNSGSHLEFSGDVHGITEGQDPLSLTIVNDNTTLYHDVLSKTGKGPFGIQEIVLNGIVGIGENFVSGLMGKVGTGVHKDFTPARFKAGASMSVILGAHEASMVMNDGSKVDAGTINVTNQALIKDHQYKASSKTKTNTDAVKASGALSMVVNSSGNDDKDMLSANIEIGDDLQWVAHQGPLVMNNQAKMTWDRVN